MAVFAAESLPEERRFDGLVLISASISADYDLNKALGHCKSGIVNFYCKADVGLLVIGTTIAGNVDGATARPPDRRVPGDLRPPLAEGGVPGGTGRAHTAGTRASVVSSEVAPWVLQSQWPAK